MRHIRFMLRLLPACLVAAALVAALASYCHAQAPQATPAATTRPAKETTDQEMSLFELLLKGRWFMVPIGLCSLVGLTVIIERDIALRGGKIIPKRFLPGLKSVFRHGRDDRERGLDYCRTNDSPIARMVAVGIGKMHKGDEAVEKAITDAGANEVHKLRRNLRTLYAVAAVSPMLGLLGTVWGMLKAFQNVSAKGLGKAGEAAGKGLATGIYEALVTTLAGLVVAIPVLIFYHYFVGKIEEIVGRMNDVSIEFVEHYTAEDLARGAREKASAKAGV
ncbi:MAG TPA: MotA/TolQ/ExbB proton channel family protein [Phycisphaerae bacterium]|nr:MotA/TolQ/ExbB proton channel family protein [Phycisphaerae bacterium]